MPFLRAAWSLAQEAYWHQGGELGNLVKTHLLPHSLGVELLPAAYARGTAGLRRFLAACGHSLDPDTPLPALLGDSLAPAPPVLDFPANVVLGNPPWRVNDQGLAFTGISPTVYDYDVGGHPVLKRWLRTRCGRVLLPAEVLTFRRIASALTFTLEVEAKIAEAGVGLGDAS
jgi:hypothetical protein